MKTKAPLILLACAIIYIAFLRECSSPAVVLDPIIIHDTIPGDPYPVEVEVTVPEPYKVTVESSVIDSFFMEVDSTAIMAKCMALARDYYSHKDFEWILKNDTSAYAAVRFSTYMNSVDEKPIFEFQNRRPMAINTSITNPPPRFKMFIGINAGGNKDRFGLGLSIAALTKKDNLYSFNYDAINKELRLTMFWKISFRGRNPLKLP